MTYSCENRHSARNSSVWVLRLGFTPKRPGVGVTGIAQLYLGGGGGVSLRGGHAYQHYSTVLLTCVLVAYCPMWVKSPDLTRVPDLRGALHTIVSWVKKGGSRNEDRSG